MRKFTTECVNEKMHNKNMTLNLCQSSQCFAFPLHYRKPLFQTTTISINQIEMNERRKGNSITMSSEQRTVHSMFSADEQKTMKETFRFTCESSQITINKETTYFISAS